MTDKAIEGRKVFERLKRQGEKVSKSKIANLASFSKSLLSKDKNEAYRTDAWRELAEDVELFLKKPHQGPVTDRLASCRAARDELERKLNMRIEEHAKMVSLEAEAKHEITYYRSHYDSVMIENNDLKATLRRYQDEFRRIEAQQSKDTTNIEAFKLRSISPDNEMLRINQGKYSYGDSIIQKRAHRAAQGKLTVALNTSSPVRLYITIGRPGCGKTTWIEQHKPPYDRLPIYYDATNSDAGQRLDIIDIGRSASNIKICFVYFDVKVETCITRNTSRPEKGIKSETVANYFLEPPSLIEGFDELIVVRE